MKYKMCYYDKIYDREVAEAKGWCTKCFIKKCPKHNIKAKELLDFLKNDNSKVLKYPDGSIRIWKN